MNAPVPGPPEELVTIVDRDNRVITSLSRRIMRRQRLIHRAAYILVFNDRDELFVQEHSPEKDIYPGCWDLAAGGVVLAGESYEEAARRELFEELGVRGRLHFLFDQYYEDDNNKVWGRVFACRHNGPLVLQAEEISSGRFMTPTAVASLIASEPATPDSLLLLDRIMRDPQFFSSLQ